MTARTYTQEDLARAYNEGAHATYEWTQALQGHEQWDKPANPYEVKG